MLCYVKVERASYNGSIEASQASDVGSIPIARSIKPVDAVGFTDFPAINRASNSFILDAVGRGASIRRGTWTREKDLATSGTLSQFHDVIGGLSTHLCPEGCDRSG